MKLLKRVCKLCVFVLMLSIVSPSTLPISNVMVAQAATIKINKKTLTLAVGKSATLKITGTKQKATWTTSSKSVATVSKTGKVTAKKAGKATITATVNKKKYTCKVTVNEKVFDVKNAPFDAQEVITGKATFVIPKDWTNSVLQEQGNSFIALIYPTSADTTIGMSNLVMVISETGADIATGGINKEEFSEEAVISQLAAQGINAKITDYKMSNYDTKYGEAYKAEYNAIYEASTGDTTMAQVIYILNIDNYVIVVTATDIGDNVSPNIDTVGEYLFSSIQIK